MRLQHDEGCECESYEIICDICGECTIDVGDGFDLCEACYENHADDLSE